MNKTTRTQNRDRANREIRRLWGDVPVVDAENGIRIFVNEEDARKAIRKDEAACIFAQACRRIYGSTKVLFFRKVAYIELPQDDGSLHVERFQMSPKMRAVVEAFDRGQGVIPKAGFYLKPPKPSDRLDDKRRQSRKEKARANRNRLDGTASLQGQGKYRDHPITVDLTVRNGTGAVKFANRKRTEK